MNESVFEWMAELPAHKSLWIHERYNIHRRKYDSFEKFVEGENPELYGEFVAWKTKRRIK